MDAVNKRRVTMEITENGYLIPNANVDQSRRHSMMANLDSPAIDPDGDHHYEPLENLKSRRKKGRTWRIFGEAKRRSRSLGPSVGQLIRRSVASSELDLENQRTSKSKTTRHKLKLTDIVIVGAEGGQEESHVFSYKSQNMSASLSSPEGNFSASEFLYDGTNGGLASPLNRIPSIGSLAAATTLPQDTEGQPALPPRRYSEGRALTFQQSLDDCALPARTLSESSPSAAVMEDELQLLRHRVEVLERRLAGELDSEDFKVLLDDRGESSTDDRSEHYATRLQFSPDIGQTFSRRGSSRYANRTKRLSLPNQAVTETPSASPLQEISHRIAEESKDAVRPGVLQRLDSSQSDDVFVNDSASVPQPSRASQSMNDPLSADNLKDLTEVQDLSRVTNIGSYKIERNSGTLVLNKVEDLGVPVVSDHPADSPSTPSSLTDTTVSLTSHDESAMDVVCEDSVDTISIPCAKVFVGDTRKGTVYQEGGTSNQVTHLFLSIYNFCFLKKNKKYGYLSHFS
ncbi:uncharacterized protein LOC129282605 [Lytechinus pictus]|uniref:uncharacterized protein LOC129282605 n=1 Tax=Lytechinus pictus TaxID=7653 RepID=UPI0030BA1CD3